MNETTSSFNPLKVAFWKNKLSGYNSHAKGLTQMQVEALHQLKAGDRLILWDESRFKQTEGDKALTLKAMRENVMEKEAGESNAVS